MIDVNAVLPQVKKYFPNVPDQDLLNDIKTFAQENPEMSNEEGIQALEEFMQTQQTTQQPSQQG